MYDISVPGTIFAEAIAVPHTEFDKPYLQHHGVYTRGAIESKLFVVEKESHANNFPRVWR
jgi:hypothetical protein